MVIKKDLEKIRMQEQFRNAAAAATAKIIFGTGQTRCIVKGEAQKTPLFWRFSGGFDFLRSACSLGIPQENL